MFTVTDKYDYSTEEVGISCGPPALIKLVSWEEGGYFVQGALENQNGHNRKDWGPCCGEIHLSASRMAKGYFGMSKADNSFYTDNNGTHWFR